jgi:hypothetical protein
MKKRPSIFISFMLLLFIGVHGQSKTDLLAGKWKYTGAMKSKATYKTDPKWYHDGKATPKFEFMEFKNPSVLTYNEKGSKPTSTKFLVVGDKLTIDGTTYTIRMLNKKDLTLYRSQYVVKEPTGTLTYIDEEQLTFEKVK